MDAQTGSQRGFTLIEMMMVIVITGIIASVVAIFIRAPVQGYFGMQARIELTDTADTALRRIGRDLRLALPNSVRITSGAGNQSVWLELLQTRTGGRYRAAPPGNVLSTADDPSIPAAAAFDVLGSLSQVPAAGDQIVVYNLGIPNPNGYANAYLGDNRAQIQGFNAASNTITLTAATRFPFESPSHRFHVVDTPVTYECNLAAGTLTRYWGYAIQAAQPAPPPASAQSALIAQNVTGCAFTYDPLLINERSGLVSMQIQLTRNNETVNLYHEVHVSNVP